MALAVDREAVVPEALAGRPGLDPGEVDPRNGEVREPLEQGTGMIVGNEGDEGCLIRAGGDGRGRRTPDQNEPGDRVRIVLDVRGQNGQSISFTGDWRGNCRIDL